MILSLLGNKFSNLFSIYLA